MAPTTESESNTEMLEGSVPKKRRLSASAGVFGDSIIPSANAFAKEYAESGPYQHIKIQNLIQDDLLREVRREILENLHFTAKETDIYKVRQTGDLANLDGLPSDELAKLTSLFRLRNALYSSTFREFVVKVTKCGPVSGRKQDMSINSYEEGCHLLCHDDVIGTRRVSYILYLPDPDEPWENSNGGALELYPCVSEGTPDVDPTVVHFPRWNQFIFFKVQPGYSFHSVQEVMAVRKPRLSISGWFHEPETDEEGYVEEESGNGGQASLSQLEGSADDAPFKTLSEMKEAIETLSDEDKAVLSEYINPTYLSASSLEAVAERFVDESCVQLYGFLNSKWSEQIERATYESDRLDGYISGEAALKHGVGVFGPWRAVSSPVKHRFLTLPTANPLVPSTSADKIGQQSVDDGPHTDAARALEQIQTHLFESEPFRRYLSLLTNLVPLASRGQSRRFRPGLDYTLATSNASIPVLDATLCFAGGGNNSESRRESEEKWKTNEVGGYECYVTEDEGNDDPAIYRGVKGSGGALVTVSAAWNCLVLVFREPGVMRFVKYVSGKAPGSRWDIGFEYEVQDD
ncbi:Oxoglutarate and iron-dependent oxygenase degradation C-term-domain-containing protein [Cladochytrium replicatum]|nr:Oxoglutarate and iron-dependent oxygenase degradation C-term-domain-containing protein [Cladochytrium replicatum]